MGGLCSAPQADQARSKQIDNEIKKTKHEVEGAIKLLLLGAGESGKSTIFKQMKIIHQRGYTEEEKSSFRPIIHSNTLQCIKILVAFCRRIQVDFQEPLQAIASRVEAAFLNEQINSTFAAQISELWLSDTIQTAYSRSSEVSLPDSTAYYLNDVVRIAAAGYIPTEQDILRTRVQTTGIVETTWNLEGNQFRMFDVGGQRNERRKWIHCFDNVTAVIFVAAMNCYDQVLVEDETQNRMHESLNLFDQICNSRWFQETAIILFLNKQDAFEEKIKHVDPAICFSRYTGGRNAAVASAYIKQQFVALSKHPDRQVYVHFTCATNTENITFVFAAVKDIALQSSLRDSRF